VAEIKTKFDVLVIGGGISGLQSALDLADQNLKVLVVEKTASIGGKMIALSKVFPTLDCSSCICTPRMASAAHNKNITIMTYSEVQSLNRCETGFQAKIIQKPRYIVEKDCTGCRLCEYACPMVVPSDFEGNLGSRKAVYVPFSNAIPQLALIDLQSCMLCGICEKACPTNAINFLQEPEITDMEIGAVIVASGFELAGNVKKQFGEGKFHNVLDSLQMERLLAPHGPYGRVLRPSDGKIPDTIAYMQCSGSRDQSVGVPYCSRVCCMYAIKQAMLLAGALPLVEITIYYMDIRAFGKGYEQFYQNAKAMGIEFVKAKVARITEDEDKNPVLRIENIEDKSQVEERKHDLAVLTPGILPGWDFKDAINIEKAQDGFVRLKEPASKPCYTGEEGIFVAGTAAGPKDIPDSIVEGGSAAMEASIYLKSKDWEIRHNND